MILYLNTNLPKNYNHLGKNIKLNKIKNKLALKIVVNKAFLQEGFYFIWTTNLILILISRLSLILALKQTSSLTQMVLTFMIKTIKMRISYNIHVTTFISIVIILVIFKKKLVKILTRKFLILK